jgi:hypothetical protein
MVVTLRSSSLGLIHFDGLYGQQGRMSESSEDQSQAQSKDYSKINVNVWKQFNVHSQTQSIIKKQHRFESSAAHFARSRVLSIQIELV